MAIFCTTSAIPASKQSAEDIARDTGAQIDFIKNKVGIHHRYVLAENETGLSLAQTACKKLLGQYDIDPSSIDLLVYVTQNPDRRIPNNAPALAHSLNIPENCASFDVSLGCSGFVYGLNIVEAFLKFNNLDRALLVTCDPYSRIIAKEDKATNAVFGDAATASLIVNSSSPNVLKAINFGTQGYGGDAIRIDCGGSTDALVASEVGGAINYARNELRLKMDGRAVFNFVNSEIPKSIEKCLFDNECTIDDIDWFALHQGSLYMLNALAKRVGIPENKLLINIEKYGNTVSSTIPLLLEELNATEGKRLKGKRVLISGFGVGLSWATGILEYD